MAENCLFANVERMKVFEARQIREIDEYTILHEPVASVDLMERAATGCADWLSSRIKPDDTYKDFCRTRKQWG